MANNQTQNRILPDLVIDRAGREDLLALWDMVMAMGSAKDIDYFERNFGHQDKGERDILVMRYQLKNAGYCIFNRQPKYAFFQKMGIPEIQDLNVLPEFRRQGIGAAGIAYCEALARREGYEQIGIGVGLYSSYGAAQKLYFAQGYIPDGNGVTYDRKPVAAGEFRMVDDNLCLMMVKTL